jgi:hypothetical protein
MLDIISSYMVREHLDYSGFFDIRLSLNIRVVNLLTAARLYVDQLNNNVWACVPSLTDAKKIVQSFFSKEYDENKEYRFMEALRNHVQHRGLPVHWTQLSSRWTSLEDDGLLEFSMELVCQRSYLEEDGRFKKNVLAELDEKIDLKSAARSYVESISNVHESVRNIIAESVQSARESIEEAHRRYKVVHSESLAGLRACKWANGSEISSIPLLLDWDDVRVQLQKRNRKLTNLRKRYITSFIKAHNK